MKVRMSRLLLPFLLLTIPLFAQTPEGEFLKIDYLQVDVDQEDQFLGQALTSWKNSQQERVENDEITGWRLYHIRFDGNRDREHNYVSVTTAKSMNAFEGPEKGVQTAEVQSSRRSRTNAPLMPLRNIKNSEIWVVRNAISRDEEAPSRFIMMDYMDVGLGREFEYQMFEDEIARPLHEDRMELDRMDAWELYELITPGGIKYGYNFATGNFFKNMDHIRFGFTEELIRANHPNVNVMEFFQTIYATRDHVESSLWELVDYVQ